MAKKLYRSHNRLIAGVCAGLAEYFNIKVKTVRLSFVAATLICGILPHLSVVPVGIYIVLALVMPLNPQQEQFSYFDLFKLFTGQTAKPNQTNSEYPKSGRKIIKDARERDIH